MAMLMLPSFSRGVIAEGLYARVDTAPYQVGLRTARNFIIHPYGGASNRQGTIFLGPTKDHDADPRIIRFQFKTQDSYVLEFGNLYMRVVRNDAYVTETVQNITAITQASPGVVTITGHGYVNGDQVFIDNIVGMTELNNRHYIVRNATTNTFTLEEQISGDAIDTTSFTAYVSGGEAGKLFEIVTPYAQADLKEIVFTQKNDVMTLTHRNYAPRDLGRTDHNAWTLTVNTYKPNIPEPTGLQVTVNSAGAESYKYKVTAISDGNPSEESLPALNNASTAITAITQANPAVVTSTSHGLENNDEAFLASIVGMTELNDRRFTVRNVTANTFELKDEDSTNYTAYSSGGTVRPTHVVAASAAAIPDNTLSWTEEPTAIKYAVYRQEDGIYGLIGETELTSYTEDNSSLVTPALTVSPPRARNPFLLSGTFPGATSYYEQRQVYGGSTDEPDTAFYSQTGRRKNMSISIPTQADDAITATLNSREVHEIRHFVPSDDLIILTSGGEWRVNAGLDVGFAFNTLRQKPQSEIGSSFRTPIVAGNTILFVDASGTRIFGLDNNSRGTYTATELSELAQHLFKENTIEDWCYQRIPDQRVYSIRDDGLVVTMTYNKNQEVVAFTDWDTDGKFVSCTSLRRTGSVTEDGIYFVVRRIIGTKTVRYLEKLGSRVFSTPEDCYFVDAGLTLDSPLTITAVTAADPVVVTAASHGFAAGDEIDIHEVEWVPNIDSLTFESTQPDQLNGKRYLAADITTNTFALVSNENDVQITGATQANPVVVTAPGHGKSNGDKIGIFRVLGMTELNGITYEVANATTDTLELLAVDGTAFTVYTSGGRMYDAEDGSAFNEYVEGGKARKAVQEISNLHHIEGKTAAVLADGSVIEDLVVTDGKITLPDKASRVHVGLQFISDFETLNFEDPRGTIQGERIAIHSVAVRVEQSRGMLIGPSTKNRKGIREIKQRLEERFNEPTRLKTGDFNVSFTSTHASEGRVFIRQRYPLPLTVLGLVPKYGVEDRDRD